MIITCNGCCCALDRNLFLLIYGEILILKINLLYFPSDWLVLSSLFCIFLQERRIERMTMILRCKDDFPFYVLGICKIR